MIVVGWYCFSLVLIVVSYFQRESEVWAEGLPGGEAVGWVKTGLLWDLGQRVWSPGWGVLQTTAGDRNEKLGSKWVHAVQWQVKIKYDA